MTTPETTPTPVPEDTDTEPTTKDFTAVFVKVAHADTFVAGLPTWSSRITDITHRKRTRTVTFRGPTDGEFFMDLLEYVGYHGAPPMGPVATLNGVKAVRCW